ncbi:hypothetical protein [Actinomadura hibisca]|uniref:hypothetical protein n=1 Tax=Actinomadura hibisca TaxID=68565 RepID=UPI00082AE8D4|nr:hypothetical protein [Actinomadura hibisca]
MHGNAEAWPRGPFGPSGAVGSTVRARRTVLAVTHHVTAATRLADVMPLLESDPRIAVAYTRAPASAFTGGLDEMLHRMGGLVLPWQQAVQTPFDLCVAASHGMLEQLHAPVLTIPHGAGPGKLLHRAPGFGPAADRPVTGLLRHRVVVDGRVVPSAMAFGHERHLRQVEAECPEALPVAFVCGDPCLDRLIASLPYQTAYRRALGTGDGRRVVLISSTWGAHSLLGQRSDLLQRVVDELSPDQYQVVVALHPHIWAWHGRRQIIAWCADGLRLLPPEEGWQAALVAADHVIGDHGSVTCYGAALGVPVLLGAFSETEVSPGSHVARLGAIAPRVDWEQPLGPQLDDSLHAFDERACTAFRDELSSRPDESARLLRKEMYRLLRLDEPDRPPLVEPVSLPQAVNPPADRLLPDRMFGHQLGDCAQKHGHAEPPDEPERRLDRPEDPEAPADPVPGGEDETPASAEAGRGRADSRGSPASVRRR